MSPWSNDPLVDPHGEALYLRDDDNGEFWSPLPGPCPADGDYEVRHGFGVTTFRHASHGVQQETQVFVSHEDPVQIALVRLTNPGRRARRLSLFAYQRLVLGVLPEVDAATIVTERDATTGALLAWQATPQEFDCIVFAACVPDRAASVSADRALAAAADTSAPSPAERQLPPWLRRR